MPHWLGARCRRKRVRLSWCGSRSRHRLAPSVATGEGICRATSQKLRQSRARRAPVEDGGQGLVLLVHAFYIGTLNPSFSDFGGTAGSDFNGPPARGSIGKVYSGQPEAWRF
jgi:hypothetical protein